MIVRINCRFTKKRRNGGNQRGHSRLHGTSYVKPCQVLAENRVIADSAAAYSTIVLVETLSKFARSQSSLEQSLSRSLAYPFSIPNPHTLSISNGLFFSIFGNPRKKGPFGLGRVARTGYLTTEIVTYLLNPPESGETVCLPYLFR